MVCWNGEEYLHDFGIELRTSTASYFLERMRHRNGIAIFCVNLLSSRIVARTHQEYRWDSLSSSIKEMRLSWRGFDKSGRLRVRK